MNRIEIFISYAHKDELLKKRLVQHLRALEYEDLSFVWQDRKIGAGIDWEKEIHEHLESANIILLLVSPDFGDSKYCWGVEVRRALERHANKSVRVIPIILKPYNWEKLPFGKLQGLPRGDKAINEISNKDKAFKDVVAQIREVVQEIRSRYGSLTPIKLTPEIADPLALQQHIREVLKKLSPVFEGRSKLLGELRTNFTSGAMEMTTQVVWGLAGVGKSQVALEYLNRHKDSYSVARWFRAANVSDLPEQFAQLSDDLGLEVRGQPHELAQLKCARALNWLSENKGWLLIFDNAQPNKEFVNRYLPQRGIGHVLITSRNEVWEPGMQQVATSVFELSEAASFLQRRTELKDEAGAIKLATELGCLALALELAGAYIRSTGESYSGYLALFKEKVGDIFVTIPDEHLATVRTAWGVSSGELSSEAAAFMKCCAFLASDNIPLSVFYSDKAGTINELARNQLTSRIQMNMVIPQLRKYSLISFSQKECMSAGQDTRMVSIHRLVQTVLRDQLIDESKIWASVAIRLIRSAFPHTPGEPSTWSTCALLLSHVLVATRHAEHLAVQSEVTASLLNDAGVYLQRRGQLEVAEQLLRSGLKISQEEVNQNQASIATLMNSLGALLLERARYMEARPLLERALEIRRNQELAKPLELAATLNQMGRLYVYLGKYAEAEPLYNKALKLRETEFGQEHDDVAFSLHDIAHLLSCQGKYFEAEKMQKRVVDIREKMLGAEHPDTALSLDNLAGFCKDLARFGEAEPLFKRALAIREEILGPEHPDTATSLNNLALLYKDLGRFGEAEPLFERALEVRERVLGADHPDTASSLDCLGSLYKDLGRSGLTEPLYKRAVSIREKVQGVEHPYTAISMNNLALLYKDLGRYDEAEPLYKKSLEVSERMLGAEHPRTATSLNNLALLYKAQGRYDEAELLYMRALEISEKMLGAEHPETAGTLNNLAALYHKQGRYSEAEPLFKHALAIREEVLGTEHPHTAVSLNNLAGLYLSEQRSSETEILFKRALDIFEKVLGAGHPQTANTLNNLAGLYREQGRYSEAKSCFQRALSASRAAYGSEHPNLLNVLLPYAYVLQNLQN